MTLLRNAAKCLRCDEEIESRHRHDFVSCRCGDIFVDGGPDYRRFGYRLEATYEDLSEYSVEPE